MDLDLLEYDPALEILRWLEPRGVLYRSLSPVGNQLSLDDLLGASRPEHRPGLSSDLAKGKGFEVPIRSPRGELWVEWCPFKDGRLYVCRETTRCRRLQQQLADTVENERQKLAEQLHDDLCQQLVGARLLAGQLQRDLASDKAPQAIDAQFLTEVLTQTTESARLLARGLVSRCAEGDFQHQLLKLAHTIGKLFRTDCKVSCCSSWQNFPIPVEMELFKIIREAVYNAAKHSGGSMIQIRLELVDGLAKITVSDNGKGFVPEPCAGMGLELMRSRATHLGAQLLIRGRPTGGTEVLCEVPLCS